MSVSAQKRGQIRQDVGTSIPAFDGNSQKKEEPIA
jgi:hypothetical protein